MRLTDKQLAKYQQLYFETFGETISKDEASVQGMAVLRLVKVLAEPMVNYESNSRYNVSVDPSEF